MNSALVLIDIMYYAVCVGVGGKAFHKFKIE
jgi:hypothetical protein